MLCIDPFKFGRADLVCNVIHRLVSYQSPYRGDLKVDSSESGGLQ